MELDQIQGVPFLVTKDVHVVLVSLFCWLSGHFVWSAKKDFPVSKKVNTFWPGNWLVKETDQYYMDVSDD